MTDTETGYIEDCCWNYIRQYCKGTGCPCRCHEAAGQEDERGEAT